MVQHFQKYSYSLSRWDVNVKPLMTRAPGKEIVQACSTRNCHFDISAFVQIKQAIYSMLITELLKVLGGRFNSL